MSPGIFFARVGFRAILTLPKMTAETISSAATKEITKMKFEMNVVVQMATRAVKLTLVAGLLAMVAVTLPQTMRAQNLLLDNFATGAVRMEGTTAVTSTTQTGTGIFGGNRLIQITPNWFGTNEFLQPVQVQVRPSSASGVPSALLLSNGYSAFPRVDLFYGPAGSTPTIPSLNLNMTLYQGFSLNFAGLSNQLEFIMLVFDVTGTYDVVECTLASNPSLRAFTLNVPTANFSGAADWSNIKTVVVSFLAANIYGTSNLAVTRFSATSSPAAGAVTCGTPTT
jgi:hypothetical protein